MQLSLNPCFSRQYSSITYVISKFPHGNQEKVDDKINDETPVESDPKAAEEEIPPKPSGVTENTKEQPVLKELRRLIARLCPVPSEQRPYYLFAADCTPQPRPYARKLSDRSSVYSPNAAPGNKPITIGHQYANLVYLPEKTPGMPPWVLPLVTQRVDTESLGHEVDIALMEKLLDDSELSFNDHLSMLVCDTPHTSTNCRRRVVSHNNLVMVARIRGNRKVFSQPGADAGKTRFGGKMNLNKKETHFPSDAEERFEITTPQDKQRIVVLKTWNDMLVRGHDGFRADKHPFTLVQVTILTSEGAEVYSKPLWLMAQGKRRGELSARQIFESYRQRFDIEHYFRFGKQRLLLDKSQTADTGHEESWWQLASLAYVQLYLAKEASQHLPYDWERYLPQHRRTDIVPSPSHVQRDFSRILDEIGTPAAAPQTRGIPPGRQKGETQEPRPERPVVYKGKKSKSQKQSSKAKEQSTGFENQDHLLKPDTLAEILASVKALLPKIDMTPEDFLEKARVALVT